MGEGADARCRDGEGGGVSVLADGAGVYRIETDGGSGAGRVSIGGVAQWQSHNGINCRV